MQSIEVEDILQVIYNRFRDRGGEWPDFDSIQRWISRFRGINIADMLDSIPDSLMKPVSQIEGSPDPSGKMVLSIEGVALCRGSDDDVQYFLEAVQWMVQRDNDYDPPEGRTGLRTPITIDELATDLRLPLFTDSKSIVRLLALLRAEGLV
jgi:hypothetical protein